jgi:hypothetical protein
VIDALSSCTNWKLSSGHFCSMATQACVCVCVCVNQCLVFVWVIPSTKDYVAKLVLDFASFRREIQSWLRKFSFLEACVCFYSCTVHIPSWVIERALESESCLVGCHQNVETNVECSIFRQFIDIWKITPSQRSVQRLPSVLLLEVEFWVILRIGTLIWKLRM